jgi:hypothetical protein
MLLRMCIRYRVNISTEPLPSNDGGLSTEPLPINNKGGYTDTHAQTATWYHKPTLFFQTKESRLKIRGLWDHLALCLCIPPNFYEEAYKITLLSVYPFLIVIRSLMRSPSYICVYVSFLHFSFCFVRSVSYQRKVGDWFFPELLVILSSHLHLDLPPGIFNYFAF